jgi:vibriolysin
MIAEDIWTPATPGDALRYLDDPAKDGASLDYYPSYTSSADVHYSSGISNLAFALLSKGGTHPRGKTTTVVTGIGVEKAARIFYKANTDLFTATTTFTQAKTYTEQAASLLGYDTATVTSVSNAWLAVGVGSATPACPPAPLANGIAVTGISGAANAASCPYTLAVPVGATNLKVEMSGGTGDVDLYVKRGSAPTPTSYDCRPYLGGNTEACTFPTPTSDTYFIVLRGFSAYSGVTLQASFTPPTGAHLFPNLSGATGSQRYYTYNAAAGQTVSVTLSPNAAGTTGDVDLYVKFGSAPTTASYNCRPYQTGNSERCTLTNPTAGTYYILLNAYSAYTGVDLTVSVP